MLSIPNRYSISDVDECTTSPCHDNAECTNTAGSFTCSCHDGYSGDGKTCRGIIKLIINYKIFGLIVAVLKYI